ncbi:MAG: ABC transporter permease [Bacillota bacterium]|nr:ABC transporter permease [Bacillota bacterium]
MTNILAILKKEMVHELRNKKSSLMLILFPIIMITILSLVLSSAFADQSSVTNVDILYNLNGNSTLTQEFMNMTREASKSGFNLIDASVTGINPGNITDTGYACYIQLSGNGSDMVLYENTKLSMEASITETMLSSFIRSYNTQTVIRKVNPASINKPVNFPEGGYVQAESLQKERAPSSLDYYTIAMLTLFIMYSALSGLWAINSERTQKTGNRILASPLRKYELLAGKTIGTTLVTIFQMAVVFIFARYILNAYMGSHMESIALVLISEIIMSISIGISISLMVKNINLASSIVNFVPVIFGFLGGAYFPLSNMDSRFLNTLSNFSPIKWSNDAIFKVVFDNDFSQVVNAVIINLSIAALIFAVASLVFRREAQLK